MTTPSDGSPVSPAVPPTASASEPGYRPTTDNQVSLDDLRSRIAPPAKAPEKIGPYKITGVLGEGGMGVVYQAVQLSLDRIVALKVVRNDLAQKEAFVGRFLREAKVAARIDHPNVVTIYDTGEADGHLFMALQYVPGGDLATRIKRDGKLNEDEALRIIAGCARGLIAIHAAGLVHRDIKPSNIFLTADGTPKIGDLGLARNIIDDEKLTFTGDLVGTPSYMAPEQARGAQDIDHRADIYSLGTSLYHLLTGRPPFQGSSPFLIGHQVIAEVPQDPRELNRAMSPVMAAIIHHAMRKDRTLRYQSAEELLVDVELLRSGKMPRFARVTVMDDERRASQTGSLAVTPSPAPGATGRSVVPVAVGVGMLVGAVVALVVGLALAQSRGEVTAPLPSAAFPSSGTANGTIPIAFPPPAEPPAIVEVPSAEFLAANEPAEGPLPAQPTRHVQPVPRTPPAAATLPEPTVVKPEPVPSLPVAVPPATVATAPATTSVTTTSATAPAPTTVLPPPVIEVDPPIPAQIADDAALRVVREAVVRVPLDGTEPVVPAATAGEPAPLSPSPTPTPSTPTPPVRNQLGPTLPVTTTPPVTSTSSTPVAATVPVAADAPPLAAAPVATREPLTPALVEQPIAEALEKPATPPAVEVPGLPTVDRSPAWASAVGADRYGSWADLTIGTVVQRFRLCPAGAVVIGSPADERGRGNDETAHRVTITQPYWLADTECTQILWRTVMGNNPSSSSGDRLPVDQVSYQQVEVFMRRVAELRPGVGVRLPSEIEWEAACRAGSRGPYTGGLDLRSLAWYRVTADGRPSAVAGRQPNAYGLFDVHGNVWEWCREPASSYPPDADGLPIATHAFVFRGGSYADAAEDCRAARRNGNQTGDGAAGVGFRLAIDAQMR